MGRFHSAVNFNIKTLIYALYLTFFRLTKENACFNLTVVYGLGMDTICVRVISSGWLTIPIASTSCSTLSDLVTNICSTLRTDSLCDFGR